MSILFVGYLEFPIVLFYMILATTLCACVPIRDVGEKALEDSFSVMTYNIWDLKGRRPAVGDVVEVIRSGSLGFRAGRENRGALKAVVMVKGRKVWVCSAHLDRVESIEVNQGGVW